MELGEAGNGNCLAWAAQQGILRESSPLTNLTEGLLEAMMLHYCGVCFADVSWTRNLFHNTMYPVVPGHEIAGVVMEVGSNVTQFKVGDHVGVGNLYMLTHAETVNIAMNFSRFIVRKVFILSMELIMMVPSPGVAILTTVVRDRYCFKIPDGYPLEFAAPLLCAGITVYTPMMYHKMNQPGKSLGVVGLGGLGHMAVKFGKAFGLNITVFSTSESKRDEAINILGVDKFVLSSDPQQMQEMGGKLDFIVDTAAGNHPFDPYLNTLKTQGTMPLVAFPSEIKFTPASLNFGAKTLAGSLTGGTKDTQSMLEYCAAHKVYPKIELIKIDYKNEALERMIKRDVKYRFVIYIENSFK